MPKTFEELIGAEFLAGLKAQGIITPTDIQEKTIPLVGEGKDVIAISRTGTGKTLAYLLPIFLKMSLEIKAPQAIILTPTHELAAQIYKQAEILSKSSPTGVKSALIIGGANIKRQLERLKEKPRIIIGSTGRILELIGMKKLSVHYVKTIVIDEFDRLLDEQNFQPVNELIKKTLRDRQLLFFSASVKEPIMNKAVTLAKEPVTINAFASNSLPENIEHIYFVSPQREKIALLRKIVHGLHIKKGIVFSNNQNEIEILLQRLSYHGIKCAALFGASLKDQRRQALTDFKECRVTLLIASDLAARGLDIKDVTHIINMDAPEDPLFYLHRVGRTGRVNEKGMAVTIALEREVQFIKKYEKKFGITIELKTMNFGNIKGE